MSQTEQPSGTTPSSREKGLIAAARQQAEHKGDSSQASKVAPLPQSFPGFDVVREIHRGGQGVVYQAIQRATKRKVAIKVFHEGPFAGARDRARFEREVDILATLDHPNIVGIIDRGTADNGSFFYVMDYVSGKTLDGFMASKKLSIDETLLLFGKICDAVNAAHLRGIIHRDLKPANIRIDSGGEPHILDFGLAKVTTASDLLEQSQMRLMTMTGQFIGSLPWASPEQASGGGANVDIRADVYSLGVILYQLLTEGRFPYPVVGNMRDVLDNIIRAEPAKPSTIRRQINDEVETIVLKSLSKDRERRYQSAGDLARDVKRYLNGEPIEAKRDSGWYLINKTIRRHKASVGAATAFVMLLAVSAIVTGVLYTQASAAGRRAAEGQAAAVAAKDREAFERQNAEANFLAVRDLARAFIFEFNRDIENLRGATRARERLLTRALDYLNKVKEQAGDDPVFMRELADAYEKVGDIQAGLFLPNVGGSISAEGSYTESRRLREAALSKSPNDPKLIGEHAQSIKRSAWVLRERGKNAEAAEEFLRACARSDEAIRAARDDAGLLRRLKDQRADLRQAWANAVRWTRSGEGANDRFQEARAAYAECVGYWTHRVAEAPEDHDVADALGVSLDQQAGAELTAGQRLREAARSIRKEKPEEALALVRESMTLFERSGSIALEAAGRFERLAAEHPASAEFQHHLWLSLHNAGEARMRLGYAWEDVEKASKDEDRAAAEQAKHEHLAAALALYERGLAIAESLWNSDEANLTAQRGVAIMLNKVGTVLIDLRQWDRSAAMLDRSLAVRREIFTTDATQMHRRDLAQALNKRALLDSTRAQQAGDPPPTRAELLRAAIRGHEAAIEHLRVLVQEGVQSEKQGDLPNSLRAIEAAERMLAEAEKRP